MDPRKILSFWRDVEIFNLPDLREKEVLHLADPLPWNEERPSSSAYKTWRYTLYFGRVPKSKVIQVIEKELSNNDTEEEWKEPVTGFTCFSALILDENGRPDERSYIQSSFIHGLNCLHNNEPISNVAEKLNQAQADYELRFQIPPADELHIIRKGDSVSQQQLEKERLELQAITKAWWSDEVIILYAAKEVQRDSVPDTSFLNSFCLDDLNTLINKDPKKYGNSLKEYLAADVQEKKRKDLISNIDELVKTLDPAILPAGRWPANISWGLYTGQVGAVNTAVDELKNEGGIRGINGPPGTGKTTLLLDIIAEVVVLRATKLINVEYQQLFDKKFNKIEDVFGGYYLPLKDVFYDKGIVASSNNNVAVQNITQALPARSKIDQEEFEGADYFASCGERLVNEKAWSILGATLGNSENRQNFKWNFWKSDEKQGLVGFEELLWSVYKDESNDQTAVNVQKYNQARTELKDLLKPFNKFQKEASAFHALLPAQLANLKEKKVLSSKIQLAQDTIDKLLQKQLKYKGGVSEKIQEIESLQQSLNLHNQHKPLFFFIQRLFNTKAYKTWNAPVARYLAQLDALNTELSTYKKEDKDNTALLVKKQKDQQALKERLDDVTEQMHQYSKKKEALHVKYEIAYDDLVDESFYQRSPQERQLCKPYSSPKINRLRSNIFLKSLEVHQYAILSNAKQFRNNLQLFMEMITGRAIVSGETARVLWNTLFFCVPVVSTTLASVSRLFSDCGEENIGWLLLDEAGQAPPQLAAGMISRSKRCVIIGDPLQIEPVVTIPATLVNKLRKHAKVEDIWSPSTTSVQLLADRISLKGTYMNAAEGEPLWTGFPLRTHRRCNDPMFSIANKLAYSNQMVKAEADQPINQDIGPSQWFHIAGITVSNKQVIKEELDLLSQKVHELISKGYQGKIFIISPFKAVQKACEHLFDRKDSQVQCGTVNAFQGREAEVVFLVLGSDPKMPGSRNWATKKPNLLNVALTRAKKRFYVIGNKNVWSGHAYFNELAASL
ncbi:hypothetical protein DBR11_17080 [Pedobacter sp. HMWF019]|uniref:DEAD/DEAH box helicase n=1 Tax=Pedobacter sp. HMWF019 TaxID=2056856 RepID=UPI000D38AF41|nr:ATP-binding protein [Pedobacter sp. HMWF019]PTS97459.1 hypothetical protein DBR11_17080 [Pedobacter sp. HMWF019]